jgi:bifunctional UDP-N-acetylglucosamine pyrophosphorylase / glucosamine-1-phosphate N-acetyltransferase
MQHSIIIMAAGKGSRMKSSTPKVLHKLCGKPMLYYIIKEAQKLSNDIHVILYHQAERVATFIHDNFDNITTIIQDHEKYPGTGGAVMAAKPKYEKVIVLNGDMPLVTASSIEPFLAQNATAVLSTFVLKDPSGYGRVITQGSEVKKVVEEKDATLTEKMVTRVNAGVYLFDKQFLEKFLPKLSNNNAQKEYYITELVELAIKENHHVAYVDVNEQTFMGVNSKIELAISEEIKLDEIRKKWMLEGVIMRSPSTIYIEESVLFDGESELESGVVIKGDTLIKESTVKANSVIEDAKIESSSVGPMARIRPQSVLKDTHIGNFVEVKKSTLTSVKAGHLSYLGDAVIDEGTNVGAGTITCNYDGKNKYQTKIGKNVFIGSDTQLVAPLAIEDDVIIAAGSTITKDISSGALAISRSEQKSIKGFFHKFFGSKK